MVRRLAPVAICPWLLRELFNARDFPTLIRAGIVADRPKDEYPTPPSRGEPPGTLSQTRLYVHVSIGRVAIVFQYRRPDGTLGASGLPDPKMLVDGNDVLYPAHADHEYCDDCRPRASFV
jgi:hypothetical protein